VTVTLLAAVGADVSHVNRIIEICRGINVGRRALAYCQVAEAPTLVMDRGRGVLVGFGSAVLPPRWRC